MSEKPLFIPLKCEYFEAFERGEKTEEFRPWGPRWNEATCWKSRKVVLSLGYGKARRLTGEVTHVHADFDPKQLPGWKECYGDKYEVAICIGIKLDTP